jgi:hypothetical protein
LTLPRSSKLAFSLQERIRFERFQSALRVINEDRYVQALRIVNEDTPWILQRLGFEPLEEDERDPVPRYLSQEPENRQVTPPFRSDSPPYNPRTPSPILFAEPISRSPTPRPQPIPLLERLSSPTQVTPHVGILTDPDQELWEVVERAQRIRWDQHAPVVPDNDGLLQQFHLNIAILHRRRQDPGPSRSVTSIDERIEHFIDLVNRRLYALEYYGISVWYDYHGNGGV